MAAVLFIQMILYNYEKKQRWIGQQTQTIQITFMIIMQDTDFVSFNVTVTITTISLVGKSVLINK